MLMLLMGTRKGHAFTDPFIAMTKAFTERQGHTAISVALLLRFALLVLSRRETSRPERFGSVIAPPTCGNCGLLGIMA
jgi:hypothetical protein